MFWHKTFLFMCFLQSSSITSTLTFWPWRFLDLIAFHFWSYGPVAHCFLSHTAWNLSSWTNIFFLRSLIQCFPPSCLSFLIQSYIHRQVFQPASVILLSVQAINSQPWKTSTGCFPCLLFHLFFSSFLRAQNVFWRRIIQNTRTYLTFEGTLLPLSVLPNIKNSFLNTALTPNLAV